MQTGAATVENSMEFPRKLKMELPFYPVITLLGLYPKNPESQIQKNLCTPMFIAAQFTLAKCWKQLRCPSVNEWITKLWYIYTVECYTAERKKELLPFMTAWVDLDSIMLSEVIQAVKDKYHVISPISRTQSAKQTREQKPGGDSQRKTSTVSFTCGI